MKNCPKCQRERDFSTNTCECGFVFAPAGLSALIIFTAINGAGSFQLVVTKPIFDYSSHVGLIGTILFGACAFGLANRKLFSIYILRVVFMLFVTAYIVFAVADLTGPQNGSMFQMPMPLFFLLYSAFSIWLIKGDLTEYFKIDAENRS